MTLRELATSPAITCPMTMSVTHAARQMMEHDIGFLVVVDEGNRPVGRRHRSRPDAQTASSG
jgi:CBS domain-containing protein